MVRKPRLRSAETVIADYQPLRVPSGMRLSPSATAGPEWEQTDGVTRKTRHPTADRWLLTADRLSPHNRPDVDHASVLVDINLAVQAARGADVSGYQLHRGADAPVLSSVDKAVLLGERGRDVGLRMVLDPRRP